MAPILCFICSLKDLPGASVSSPSRELGVLPKDVACFESALKV